MEIHLLRDLPTEISTGGCLYWPDWQLECHTLEDIVREQFDWATGRWVWRSDLKVPKLTAIPSGRYEVIIDFSNRFQRAMPHILDVPDFAGIRIHGGRLATHTEGCPLVGRRNAENRLLEAKEAFDAFFPKLEAALLTQKVFINIVNSVLPIPMIEVTQ